jgi:hypothetical protein
VNKETIDKHFTENIKYYRKVIHDKYYKNYLADDLLQETYLKFVEVSESIQSNEKGVLLSYGKKIISTLFSRRNTHNNFRDCQTSPLFEIGRNNIPIENCCKTGFKVIYFKEEQRAESDLSRSDKGVNNVEKSLASYDEPFRDKEQELRIVERIVRKGLEENDFNTGVHVMAQIESINAMSKRTGINRGYLTRANKEKQNHLKNEIIKAYENGIITTH